MIDFIKAIKYLSSKNTFFTGYLQEISVSHYGLIKYHAIGCKDIEIWYYERSHRLELRGSMMYYIQGHNFSFNKKLFIEAINHIEKLINVDLWDAVMETVEYGAIVQLEPYEKPKDYISHHQQGKGVLLHENPKDKGCFRKYTYKSMTLKLYDVNRNIKYKQSVEMRKRIQECGWDPSQKYLKFEAHYEKPHLTLNRGRDVLLKDLITSEWDDVLKADLLAQYNKLIPMSSIIEPTDKKKLSTADIIFSCLAELKINDGKSIEEVKKMVYDKINGFPEQLLSKTDKKARKAQVNKIKNKIKFSDKSRWDLYDRLNTSTRG